MAKQKTKSASKRSNPDSEESSERNLDKIQFITTLVKEFGLAGTFLIFCMVTFLFVFSGEQQATFIDKFILFKDFANNKMPFYTVVIGLVFLNLVQFSFLHIFRKAWRDEIGRKNDRINDLISSKTFQK